MGWVEVVAALLVELMTGAPGIVYLNIHYAVKWCTIMAVGCRTPTPPQNSLPACVVTHATAAHISQFAALIFQRAHHVIYIIIVRSDGYLLQASVWRGWAGGVANIGMCDIKKPKDS